MPFGPPYDALMSDGSRLSLCQPSQIGLDALLPTPPTVWRQGGEEDPSVFFRDSDSHELLTYLRDDEDTLAWGIEAYEQLVGLAGLAGSLNDRSRYPGGFVYIMNRQFWRQGIGARSRAIVSQHAFAAGCGAVRAHARHGNVASQAMLRHLGFHRTDRGGSSDWQAFLLPSPHIDFDPGWGNELSTPQVEVAQATFRTRLGQYAIRALPPDSVL